MIAPRARRSKIIVGQFGPEADAYEVSADHEIVSDARRSLERTGLRQRHLILMVHGWNVGPAGEAGSFDLLLNNIARLDPQIANAVLTVTWPSKGRYWTIARTVAAAASAVATKIASPSSPFHRVEELVVIAHSMGCAFALELCEALRTHEKLPVRPHIRLFLMAAAVPVRAVSEGTPKTGQPEGRLHKAATSCERTFVYHSHFDIALGLPFRFGERVYSGNGGEEAVGAYGHPDALWSWPVEMLFFGHGDYWRSPDIAQDIVEEILRPARRSLPARRF